MADKQILARIVKECVSEAAGFTIPQLEMLIPSDIQIASSLVDRMDAASRPVRQENTEDGTVDEGTVPFDILFTLGLPGRGEPVLVIINVEIQNRGRLPYPLERRAMVYASRLVGRQGTDYAGCKKVYSIWIVTDPGEKGADNTSMKLVTARQHRDGTFEAAPKEAQVAEVWFLNLGSPAEEKLSSALLQMLDVVFSGSIGTDEKLEMLRDDHGFRITAEIAENLEEMLEMELAIESRARDVGIAEGVAKGMAKGIAKGAVDATLRAGKAFSASPETILALLNASFHGDVIKAKTALEDYLREHPEGELAELVAAVCEAAGRAGD